MMIDIRNDHEFVGVGFPHQCLDAGLYVVYIANNRSRKHPAYLDALLWGPIAVDIVNRRLAEPVYAAEYIGKGNLLGRRQPARLRPGGSGDDVDADHRIRPRELRRRLESAAVKLQCREQHCGREM